MKFSVCIKQVPDVTAPMHLRDRKLVYDPGRTVLNAYDASAVEAALVLIEKAGGSVEVVLAGPERAQETLRKALAMGADSATHLRIDDGETLDSRAWADVLAQHFETAEYDVIACGKQSQDTDAGLTGSMLAELLGLPYATNAVALEVDADRRMLIVTRQGDGGQEVVELPAPCLVTCSNDMNDPRIPSLKGIMAAKRKPLHLKEDLQPRGGLPSTRVLGYEPMPEREPGRLLEGEAGEIAQQLVQLLRNEARVV